ncbi:hypothetical protein ABK040_012564 [Willaertia magna]
MQLKVNVRCRSLNKESLLEDDSMKWLIENNNTRNNNKNTIHNNLNKTDINKNTKINKTDKEDIIKIQKCNYSPHTFSFQHVFTKQNCTQELLYNKYIGKQLKLNFLNNGKNCTLITYGQSHSGKSYLLEGKLRDYNNYLVNNYNYNEECLGIIPRFVKDLFKNFITKNRKIYFLKNKSNFSNLNFPPDIHLKSNFILSINLESITNNITKKINFVELAGSEKAREVNVSTTVNNSSIYSNHNNTLYNNNSINNFIYLNNNQSINSNEYNDGIKITKTFHSLFNVISQLSNKSKYINYRDSKLTLFLKDTLNENSFIYFISTIYLLSDNFNEIINTLKYTFRLKQYGCNDSDLVIDDSGDVNDDSTVYGNGVMVDSYGNGKENLSVCLQSVVGNSGGMVYESLIRSFYKKNINGNKSVNKNVKSVNNKITKEVKQTEEKENLEKHVNSKIDNLELFEKLLNKEEENNNNQLIIMKELHSKENNKEDNINELFESELENMSIEKFPNTEIMTLSNNDEERLRGKYLLEEKKELFNDSDNNEFLFNEDNKLLLRSKLLEMDKQVGQLVNSYGQFNYLNNNNIIDNNDNLKQNSLLTLNDLEEVNNENSSIIDKNSNSGINKDLQQLLMTSTCSDNSITTTTTNNKESKEDMDRILDGYNNIEYNNNYFNTTINNNTNIVSNNVVISHNSSSVLNTSLNNDNMNNSVIYSNNNSFIEQLQQSTCSSSSTTTTTSQQLFNEINVNNNSIKNEEIISEEENNDDETNEEEEVIDNNNLINHLIKDINIVNNEDNVPVDDELKEEQDLFNSISSSAVNKDNYNNNNNNGRINSLDEDELLLEKKELEIQLKLLEQDFNKIVEENLHLKYLLSENKENTTFIDNIKAKEEEINNEMLNNCELVNDKLMKENNKLKELLEEEREENRKITIQLINFEMEIKRLKEEKEKTNRELKQVISSFQF